MIASLTARLGSLFGVKVVPRHPTIREQQAPLKQALDDILGITRVSIHGMKDDRCVLWNVDDFRRAADYFQIKTLKQDAQVYFEADLPHQSRSYRLSFAMVGTVEEEFVTKYGRQYTISKGKK